MKKVFALVVTLFLFLENSNGQKNLTLAGSLLFQGQTLAACWHYNHVSGSEYALVGAANGIAIVDITAPANPVLLFQLPGVNNLWHEVKVQGDYAYAVSEGIDPAGVKNGVQIIDLRYLPDSAPNKFYYGDGAILNMLEKSHSITTAGHYAYVNGHNITSLGRGVLILDITNPTSPVYVGAITNRYCHDSYVRGNFIYTSDILDGLFSVYDISNPALPVLLATQVTPGTFNHSTWLSDDGRTIFAADERTNTPVASYDISDLNNISLLDTFFNGNFKTNEVHNVRVINDYLINPSYGSQLTIADVSRPDNMIEVASYTTGNSLCWDADPFPNSGNILATDMQSGMFYIFSPQYIRACYLEGLVTDSVTGLPIIGASIDFTAAGIMKSSDLLGVYKTGYADSGTYNITYSKPGYISKIRSVVLQNGVVTTKNVRLVPIGAGINEPVGMDIHIFPSPASDFLNVQTLNNSIISWQILDLTGRCVKENSLDLKPENKFSIDVEDLSAGVYFLSMYSLGENHLKRFIKR